MGNCCWASSLSGVLVRCMCCSSHELIVKFSRLRSVLLEFTLVVKGGVGSTVLYSLPLKIVSLHYTVL